jgi:hypothetical protein
VQSLPPPGSVVVVVADDRGHPVRRRDPQPIGTSGEHAPLTVFLDAIERVPVAVDADQAHQATAVARVPLPLFGG